jgi:OOP family OmpA-OmpF porin
VITVTCIISTIKERIEMKIQNAITGSVIIAGSLMSAAALAQSAAGTGTGWYAGAGIGQSRAQDLDSIDGTLAGAGVTSSSATSSIDTAWKLFGGYQFTPYIAAEGGYTNLGKFDVNSSVAGPISGTGAGTWEAKNIWSLAAVGTLPITSQFAAIGKLGLAYSKVNFDYTAPGVAISQSNTGTSPLYGLGVKYNFTPNTAVRGEWERYSNLGDASTTGKSSVDAWTMSVQYNF